MASPFDYVKAISSKECFWNEDGGESYTPWMINKSLSFMQDCIYAANEMNKRYDLDKKLQYDFYFNFVSKKKRYGAWIKKEVDPSVQIIAEYFCINNTLAEKYISLLTQEQIQIIRDKMNRGGR